MAYDAPHLLFTVHGHFSAQRTEEWSFGVRSIYLPKPSAADMQTLTNNLLTPSLQFVGTVTSTPFRLSHVKLAWIGADGHYPPGEVGYEAANPSPGDTGGSATSGPYQQALAVSMSTAVLRGKASKGRFYLPRTKYPIGVDGRHAAADAMNVANAAKIWLLALRTATPVGMIPSVFSQGTVASPGPSHSEITGVRVGLVPDTIRSRRRSLVEEYQSLPLF